MTHHLAVNDLIGKCQHARVRWKPLEFLEMAIETVDHKETSMLHTWILLKHFNSCDRRGW